jgi:hypothetical protein
MDVCAPVDSAAGAVAEHVDKHNVFVTQLRGMSGKQEDKGIKRYRLHRKQKHKRRGRRQFQGQHQDMQREGLAWLGASCTAVCSGVGCMLCRECRTNVCVCVRVRVCVCVSGCGVCRWVWRMSVGVAYVCVSESRVRQIGVHTTRTECICELRQKAYGAGGASLTATYIM